MRGHNSPDQGGDILTWEGHTVPVGDIVKEEAGPGQYTYRPEYSEYIVADQENVMVRYILRLARDSQQGQDENSGH